MIFHCFTLYLNIYVHNVLMMRVLYCVLHWTSHFMSFYPLLQKHLEMFDWSPSAAEATWMKRGARAKSSALPNRIVGEGPIQLLNKRKKCNGKKSWSIEIRCNHPCVNKYQNRSTNDIFITQEIWFGIHIDNLLSFFIKCKQICSICLHH